MSTDFIIFFIFIPSLVPITIIAYFVAIAVQKKKKQEEERKQKEQRDREWKEFFEYLDKNPIAKEVFTEKAERDAKHDMEISERKWKHYFATGLFY